MNRLFAIFAALLVLAALPSAAHASKTQESMFQDDIQLVYGTPEQVEQTLNTLSTFGVDRIRISVFWQIVAPANTELSKPSFDATDPAQYPAENWARYDSLIQGALARGMLVNLNITSPIPRWAAQEAPRPDLQDTWAPTVDEFGQFVKAVGTRYSGTYQGLPRVDYWSIWNEPNQAGWLTPQWAPDPANASRQVEAAPQVYRQLVRAAWTALADSGHGTDTILVGETAPQGEGNDTGITQSIDALRFIRQLYCLDNNRNLLKGNAAVARGCPDGNPQQFIAENPALFHASGYAHHPYQLLLAPGVKSLQPDHIALADLGKLSTELKKIYQRYGQKPQSKRGVPLYLTEYGYQTKPDPTSVSFAQQAAFLNQAEYMTFKNPNVRAMSQFLLIDDGTVPGIDPKKNPRLAYRTFQSGLVLLTGKHKPSYKAYITPIWLKQRRVRSGRTVGVFGMLRGAQVGTSPRVTIQFRAKGRKRWTAARTRTVGGDRHYFETRVRVRRTGYLRLRWRNGATTLVSRPAPIAVRR